MRRNSQKGLIVLSCGFGASSIAMDQLSKSDVGEKCEDYGLWPKVLITKHVLHLKQNDRSVRAVSVDGATEQCRWGMSI